MSKNIHTLRQIGNSTGLTLTTDELEKAGLKKGDQVAVRVIEKGRVEISLPDDERARLNDSFNWVTRRYSRTLTDLSK